jgi:NitT/TauT family transport system substrate-binding protein
MKRIKFIIIIISIIAAGVTVYAIWKKETKIKKGGEEILKTARIGYQKTILYLPLFVAKENGYFKDEKVEVELIPFGGAPEMLQAMIAGQIDATGMSALDVLSNIEQENIGQFKMFLIEEFSSEKGYSPDYILTKPNAGINNIKDLKDRKLGIRSGTTIEMYSKIILRKFDIDPEKNVQLIKLPEELQIQALESGQINALFTFDPTATIIIDRGIGKSLEHPVLSKYLMNEPTSIYPGSGVFSADFVKRDKETARRVRDAIYRAVDYIAAYPQESKRILPKYTPIASHIAEKVSLIKWVKVKDLDKEKVQDLIDMYYKNGLLKKCVDLRNTYLMEADIN